MQLSGRPAVPEGYAIQLADPGHIPRLNDIELAAAGIFPAGSLPERVRLESLPREALTRAMDQGRLWVALDKDENPVGYAMLEVVGGAALLAQMDVRPEHGRQGLGAAMVRRVARQVGEMGIGELFLTTFSHVPWNAPFYRKMGFEALDPAEQPGFVQGILAEERQRGLENRVAMRLRVCAGSG